MIFNDEFAKRFIRLDAFFQSPEEAKRVKEVLTFRESLWFGCWLFFLPVWLPLRSLVYIDCYIGLYTPKWARWLPVLAWRAGCLALFSYLLIYLSEVIYYIPNLRFLLRLL